MAKNQKLLCRDIVGRRVRLLKTVTTVGGWSFKKGRVMRCLHSWRGQFNLEVLAPWRVKEVRTRLLAGNSLLSRHTGIRQVSRRDFEVI